MIETQPIWEIFNSAFENNDILLGLVTEVQVDGWIIEIGGGETFLPKHDIELYPMELDRNSIGKELEVQIVELNEKEGTVVVSRSAVLEEKQVEVWLMFSQYSISFRYKLLSELGEISHFILGALNKQSMSEQDLEQVTGLDRKQLSPVFTRLVGLRLVESNKTTLTKKGKVVAHILENIHEHEIEVAIDRHYHHKYKSLGIFLIPNGSYELTLKPSDAIKLPQVKEIRYGKQEDCFKQSERLQRHLPTLLPKLVPESEKILSELGNKWGTEWDVSVRATDDTKGICTKLKLKKYEEIQEDVYFNLYTPLILLKTNYILPEGFKWDKLAIPSTLMSVFSESDDEIYDKDYSVTDTSMGEILLSGGNNSIDQEYAKALIDNSLQLSNSSSDIFSRQYHFSKAWQAHQYSYEELINGFNFNALIRI